MREAAGFIIFFSDGQHEICSICAVCQKLARKKQTETSHDSKSNGEGRWTFIEMKIDCFERVAVKQTTICQCSRLGLNDVLAKSQQHPIYVCPWKSFRKRSQKNPLFLLVLQHCHGPRVRQSLPFLKEKPQRKWQGIKGTVIPYFVCYYMKKYRSRSQTHAFSLVFFFFSALQQISAANKQIVDGENRQKTEIHIFQLKPPSQ